MIIMFNNVDNSSTTNDSFLKSQVLARAGFLASIPSSTITSAVNMIVGVGAGFATIVTGGKCSSSFRLAMDSLDNSQKTVSVLYMNFLKTLNPQARFVNHSKAFITADGDGFITNQISTALKALALNYLSSENVFKRHIASRLTYALLAISSVVTRVADGIIGSVAAVLSLLTLGKVESMNNLAYRGLQIPGIIKDLFYCAAKIINPWTGNQQLFIQQYPSTIGE